MYCLSVFYFMIFCEGEGWTGKIMLSWHTFRQFLGILAYKRGGLQWGSHSHGWVGQEQSHQLCSVHTHQQLTSKECPRTNHPDWWVDSDVNHTVWNILPLLPVVSKGIVSSSTTLHDTSQIHSVYFSFIHNLPTLTKKTLAARGLEELFSSCAVVSVFGSGGK